jgi:hypothetical protein
MLAILAPAAGQGDRPDRPVLVELFTSEGCSSCPPADAALARLVEHPPEGVRVIALGEHVDYWDGLGWKDRFSAPLFTRRQEAYVQRFGLSGPYTPQLVVAGRAQLAGGEEGAARVAISAAARAPVAASAEIHLAGVSPFGDLQLDTRAEWGGREQGEVLVALVQDRARSSVAAGENAGKVLEHVAVVRWLAPVAHGTRGYRGTVRAPHAVVEGSDRVVLIVQERGGGPVWAVATEELGRAR